jgi:diadenylate cyclase
VSNLFDFSRLIENLREYTKDFSAWGIIRLILDLLLVIAFFYMMYRILRTRAQGYRVFLLIFIIVAIYLLSFLFELSIFLKLLEYVFFWGLGIFIIVYNQEIRHALDLFFIPPKTNSTFSSREEKMAIINILLNTVDFLSRRKIGALITIEREDNLNIYIEKAIILKAVVSQELLTTIFAPGTACHDGAVIIRKNIIMCAGAYFPSTDKYDVPKFLGTRHRAAIGISERTDALTIVVSEETGNVSVAIDGLINLKLSREALEEILDRHLNSK